MTIKPTPQWDPNEITKKTNNTPSPEADTIKFSKNPYYNNKEKNLNYIKGYVRKKYPLDLFKKQTQYFQSEKTSVDKNTENFKYIPYFDDIDDTDFYDVDLAEDPLYPGFSIILDGTSPLLLTNEFDYLNNISAAAFINSYDIGSEKKWMLLEFNRILRLLFDVKDSDYITSPIKTHYISKIDGLEVLSKKIIDYKKDKITMTFTEDITMLITYLAELYNNLSYSYKDKRLCIPENCLRFKMIIQFKDVRDFKVPVKYEEVEDKKNILDSLVPDTFKHKKIEKNIDYPFKKSDLDTSMNYSLYDCNFDFVKSNAIGPSNTVAGFGAGRQEPAELTVDIYFKSVSKKYMSNARLDMDNSMSNSLVDRNVTNIEDMFQYQKPTQKDLNEKSGLASVLMASVEGKIKTIANAALGEVRELRGELIDKFMDEVSLLRGKIGLFTIWDAASNSWINQKIYPDNVYSKEYEERLGLKQTAASVVSNTLNEIQDAVGNSLNFPL